MRAPGGMVALGLLIAAIGMSGCSSSAESKNTLQPQGTVPTVVVKPVRLGSTHVDHAIGVAQAIRASGLGCREANVQGRRRLATVGATIDGVSCAVGGDIVEISAFADQGALTSVVKFFEEGACNARPQPAATATYVLGENWIAVPQEASTAGAIARATRGKVGTFHC